MLTIHPLTTDRIAPCALNLCMADVDELEAAGIRDVVLMMERALPECAWAHEARWMDEPVAMFGVRSMPPEGEIGIPWMLTTDAIHRAARATVGKEAKRAVARMRKEYAVLTNLVHANNGEAIRFVEWLGFTVLDELTGPSEQFRQFIWRRDVQP